MLKVDRTRNALCSHKEIHQIRKDRIHKEIHQIRKDRKEKKIVEQEIMNEKH